MLGCVLGCCAPIRLCVEVQDAQLQLIPCTANSCQAVLSREYFKAWNSGAG